MHGLPDFVFQSRVGCSTPAPGLGVFLEWARYFLKTLWVYAGLNMLPTYAQEIQMPQASNTLTVIGVAENAKLGAMIQSDSGENFFIEGLRDWPALFLRKRVKVTGQRLEKRFPPSSNEKTGEYAANPEGKVVYLAQAALPRMDKEAFNLIVFFRKGVASNRALEWLESTAYPFVSGADSSKGKLYFYDSGGGYRVVFPNSQELTGFQLKYQSAPEIKEIYVPNWSAQKD